MIKRIYLILVISVTACAILGSTGCAFLQNSDKDAPPKVEPIATAHPFPDLPIPPGFDRDDSKSFVYESGSGTVKVGRLFFWGWNNQKETVTFYQNEMVNQGWALVNSMEHESTIMHFEKEGWVCSLVIRPTFLGSEVEVQIGPK